MLVLSKSITIKIMNFLLDAYLLLLSGLRIKKILFYITIYYINISLFFNLMITIFYDSIIYFRFYLIYILKYFNN